MAVHFFRTEHTAAELRKLAGKEKGRVAKRFLMIANMLDGMDHAAAARAAGMGRTSAYKWHNIYEEEGIEGLRQSSRGGSKPKVSEEVGQSLKDRILAGASLEEDNIIAFRAHDIRRILHEEHGIELSLGAVYNLLHRLGLSWLMPRPQHPGSDAQAQEDFRKHFICN